jgi:hypothetical protein
MHCRSFYLKIKLFARLGVLEQQDGSLWFLGIFKQPNKTKPTIDMGSSDNMFNKTLKKIGRPDKMFTFNV